MIETHLFIPDIHIPDHDERALKVFKKAIPEIKADVVHFLGDVLNFTKVANYEMLKGYTPSIKEEILQARVIFNDLITQLKKANSKVKIKYYEGNHEDRLNRYLMRNAQALVDLPDKFGDSILTVPTLLYLKELGVEWIPYTEVTRVKNFIVEHGDIASNKAGATAHKMIQRRGKSGFSGHTHRLAFVATRQGDNRYFWLECGSLCKQNPKPRYVREPDWQQGFAVGHFNTESKIMHPTLIPLINYEFYYNSRLFICH